MADKKAEQMHNSKGKHTGKIRHPDMTSLIDGVSEDDPHASAEFHKANKEHGMPHGMHPQGGYHMQDEHDESEGGMHENEEYC